MLNLVLKDLPKIYPIKEPSKDVFFVADFELCLEEKDLNWLRDNYVDEKIVGMLAQSLYRKMNLPHFYVVLVYKQTKNGPQIRVLNKKIRCSQRKLKYLIGDPFDTQLRYCLTFDARLYDEELEKELLGKIENHFGKKALLKEF